MASRMVRLFGLGCNFAKSQKDCDEMREKHPDIIKPYCGDQCDHKWGRFTPVIDLNDMIRALQKALEEGQVVTRELLEAYINSTYERQDYFDEELERIAKDFIENKIQLYINPYPYCDSHMCESCVATEGCPDEGKGGHGVDKRKK